MNLSFKKLPDEEDEVVRPCEGAELQLNAPGEDVDHLWSTGGRSQHIIISSPASFWVDLISAGACSVRKNFDFIRVEKAVIRKV